MKKNKETQSLTPAKFVDSKLTTKESADSLEISKAELEIEDPDERLAASILNKPDKDNEIERKRKSGRQPD